MQVPLGVLLRNENRTEDMIEILEEVHQYVPELDGGHRTVFIGGDQLTCERIRGAKNARLQSTTSKERLEGITEKVEDWHALQAYYQVGAYMHTAVQCYNSSCTYANRYNVYTVHACCNGI